MNLASDQAEEVDQRFPVVGIGASAGGLAAFESFLSAVPIDCGMAFVVMQHSNPNRVSELADVLQRSTSMPVTQVNGTTRVQPNRVYVIPPDRRWAIQEGVLQLAQPHEAAKRPTPVDDFLRTLSQDRGEQAICVILSGAGADGLLGLKSVKERGGIVLVQSPDEAQYDGMPQNAIESGLADLVAPAAELARRLVQVQSDAPWGMAKDRRGKALAGEEEDALYRILAEVHSQIGQDFRFYKRSTILRRIGRRMRVNGFDTLVAYLAYLRNHQTEINTLFKDFLISVTNFFRDRAAFDALANQVIPLLFEDRRPQEPVRIWVPGCASGEEAYSLAMLLDEAAPPNASFQIFATDLDEEALAKAREGLYPDVIAADVSPERLARHFSREDQGYRINEDLRRTVLFTRHNLISDPPFSRLDLISCRNLLIYFDRNVQQRVFDRFHFALLSDGFLFLGNSETVGAADRFQAIDKRHRIYQRVRGSSRLLHGPLDLPAEPVAGRVFARSAMDRPNVRLSEFHRELMLQRYAPPSLLVDSNYDVRYLFGDVGRYFHPAEGEPNHNLLQNIDGPLRVELRAALFRVFQKDEIVEPRRITLVARGETETILLRVEAVQGLTHGEELALVIFEPVESTATPPLIVVTGNEEAEYSAVAQLEDELQRTRQRLQTLVEEYETANEELKASNSELRSTNEELWSTTEELETSKEELQSANEELHTVNSELKSKIDELSHANGDLQNLMASTQIATLFLDRRLCLKRFTPEAMSIFNLIPADLGRPFAHISHHLLHDDLPALAAQVLVRLEVVEKEIQSRQGHWYIVRLLPYRSMEESIDGVVVTLIDISELKRYQTDILVRERQQAAVAELGLRALTDLSLTELMAYAVDRIIATLNVPMCKVLELLPDGAELLLKTGVGWQDGLVGHATVETDRRSQAGYTLYVNGPVVVKDLATETRFQGPMLLHEHGVVSGISVVIQGETQPYGVLGAHTTEHRNFTAQDANFLQSMANVLGAAIERSAAEAEVQASERLYHDALRNSPVVFARVDRELRYEWIFNAHLDFDRETVIGKRDDELDSSPGGLELMQLKREVLEDRKQQRRIIAFERSNGVLTYDITATPVLDDNGKVLHLITTALDISERRRALQALSESKALFEAVLKNLPTGVIIAEAPTGRMILGNEQVAAIFRHPFLQAEDIEGYRAYKGFHLNGTPLQPEEWPLARAILHGDVTQDVEILFARGDGTVGTLSVSATPVYDQNGAITAGVVIFDDISERKQAEAELHRLNETLEERIEERTAQLRMLASQLTLAEQRERRRVSLILHDDLQQLLFAVQFQLRVLENMLNAQDLSSSTQILQRIKAVIERSLQVTRTLSIDLSPPVLRGEGLVEAVKWLGSQMKELHGLEIQVEATAPISLVSVDMRILLFHLVRELLLNVVKHADVDKAVVLMGEQDGVITIQVEDKGSGFVVSELGPPPPGEIGGGLFHMQERLALFGGSLVIDSSPTDGTRAVLQVPIHNDRVYISVEESP